METGTIQQHFKTVTFANESERAVFIRKTYIHLALAILCFLVVETILVNSPIAPLMLSFITGGYAWLIVLGAFMGVSYFADKWARSTTSVRTQYWGLGLYVVAEAIVFLPLLFIATSFAPDLLLLAGVLTLVLFVALTLFAFTNKINFSFLRGFLAIGGMIALGTIVASMVFGFTLGLWFSSAMILFATGAILYDTSNVLREYGPGQHVSASLSLFASVALLFWYILQFLMSATDR